MRSMIIQKKELSNKIESIKSGTAKGETYNPWQGILLKDGYLTASNSLITIKTTVGVDTDESFIIPQKAFELIKRLPDGNVDISTNSKNEVVIKMGNIKNIFQSMAPDSFMLKEKHAPTERKVAVISGDLLKVHIKKVLYAVAKEHLDSKACAIYISCKDGCLNFVGTDARMMAWDHIETAVEEMEMLIPREAAERLIQLDLKGEAAITYDESTATFTTENYIFETSLVNGKYFAFEKLFEPKLINAVVKQSELLEAVNRAASCSEQSKKVATRLQFKNESIQISLGTNTAQYSEVIPLENRIDEPLLIAFDSKLLIDTLKAFGDSYQINLNLGSGKEQMIVTSDSDKMKAFILPVDIGKS